MLLWGQTERDRTMNELIRCGKLLCYVACAVTATSARVDGVEIVVKNDSVTGVVNGTPCTCFIPGEIPASWLTMPFDGTLVGVQVFWQSQLGGAPDSFEMGVHVYASGTFPTPGAVLASVTGPTLTDGVLNEYRHTDPPTNIIPINLAVTAGQTIVVGVEMINQSAGGGPFTPSTSSDQDGCQTGKNVAFAIPGGWADACLLGVTGDWAIRAIVVPDNDIPTVSQWGFVVLAVLILGAGTLVYQRRRCLIA